MSFAFSWGLAVFFIVSLQSSLTYFLSYNGIRPDFALIFAAFAGILHGRVHGMVVGFFCGLLLDLLNTGFFGFNALLLLCVGMISGMIQKKVFEDSILLPLVLIFTFSIGQQIIWNACLLVSGYNLTDYKMLLYMSLASIIYNTAITLPLLFLFKKIKKLIG